MTAPAVTRPIEELQQLQEAKQRELAAVQDELETARWVADYDAAEMYRPERARVSG